MSVAQKCKVYDCKELGKLDNKTAKRYYVKGYCGYHYQRAYNGTEIAIPRQEQRHGEKRHLKPEYRVYAGIKARCTNPNNKEYRNYGGRGIGVSERWLGIDGFTNFIADMGERPSGLYSIERIDVNGNYEPSNCRWATIHEQCANKRNNTNVVGVSWDKSKNVWRVHMLVKGINHRKCFKDYDDAVKQRQGWELLYLGKLLT